MRMSEAEGGRIFFSSKGRTLEGEDEIVILSVQIRHYLSARATLALTRAIN